jgi:hypothetical protein
MAEGVWDLKDRLEKLDCGSGLEVRVGNIGQVVQNIVDWYSDERYGDKSDHAEVTGIWMTSDIGTEEKTDESHTRSIAEKSNIEFKLWKDDKYYVDEFVPAIIGYQPSFNVFTDSIIAMTFPSARTHCLISRMSTHLSEKLSNLSALSPEISCQPLLNFHHCLQIFRLSTALSKSLATSMD